MVSIQCTARPSCDQRTERASVDKGGSVALDEQCRANRSDAFCSFAVLIGLGIVRWGGQTWIGADEAAALIVAIAIIWSAFQLFRSSASELMDVQAHDEFVSQIRQVAEAVPDVAGDRKHSGCESRDWNTSQTFTSRLISTSQSQKGTRSVIGSRMH